MAHLPRHLGLLALAGLLLAAAPLRARPPGAPGPATFQALAVGNTPGDLRYDLSPGRHVVVEAGGMYLSRPYTCPAGGTLSFYRLRPPAPPATEPVRVPVATVPVSPSGAHLIVFASTPDPAAPDAYRTRVHVYDNSWEAHPGKFTRVLNFSRRPVAVQFADEIRQLQPGEAHLFPADVSAKAQLLKVARLEENQWILKLRRLQGGIPGTRLTLLVSDVPPTPENPDPREINITHVFDRSKPPGPDSG